MLDHLVIDFYFYQAFIDKQIIGNSYQRDRIGKSALLSESAKSMVNHWVDGLSSAFSNVNKPGLGFTIGFMTANCCFSRMF